MLFFSVHHHFVLESFVDNNTTCSIYTVNDKKYVVAIAPPANKQYINDDLAMWWCWCALSLNEIVCFDQHYFLMMTLFFFFVIVITVIIIIVVVVGCNFPFSFILFRWLSPLLQRLFHHNSILGICSIRMIAQKQNRIFFGTFDSSLTLFAITLFAIDAFLFLSSKKKNRE